MKYGADEKIPVVHTAVKVIIMKPHKWIYFSVMQKYSEAGRSLFT